MYNRDARGTRHSPLAQITPANVARLRQAWSVQVGKDSSAGGITGGSGGTLSRRGMGHWAGDATAPPRVYFTAGRRLIALDAKSGQLVPGFGAAGILDIERQYIERFRKEVRTSRIPEFGDSASVGRLTCG